MGPTTPSQKRWWPLLTALAFLLMGALSLSLYQQPASYLSAAASLCFAWLAYFGTKPPASRTIGDIYRSSRQGWRMPLHDKLVGWSAMLLVVLFFYFQFKQYFN